MTTEAVSGQATLLLYQNFLFNTDDCKMFGCQVHRVRLKGRSCDGLTQSYNKIQCKKSALIGLNIVLYKSTKHGDYDSLLHA